MKAWPLKRRTFLSLTAGGLLNACNFGGGGGSGTQQKQFLPPAGPASPASLSAAPGASASPASGQPSITIGAPNTLNITNSTTYPNSAINVYVVGQNPQGGAWSALQANGTLVALNGAAPALALTQETTSFPLPYLQAARIYFAINGTLNLTGSSGGATQPAGWVSSDPSYNTLFDWVEFDYAAGTGLYCNTTQVDMFGIPFTIQIGGANNAPIGQATGVDPGLRTTIFSAIRALGAPFSNLIVTSNGTDLRVIYPGFAIASGLFPSNYLDSYIQSVWTYYQTNTLTLNTTAYGTWTGTVSGGTFTFTQNGQTVTIAQPSTSDTLQCAGPLASGSSPAGSRIQAIIAAGLNRGSLLTSAAQPDFNATDFYTANPIHQYAKIIHQYSIANRAYAFAYDDEGGFDSTIASTASGASLNIGISAF